MYNNKLYNTRSSGRFNTPGQFVSAGDQPPQQPSQQPDMRRPPPQQTLSAPPPPPPPVKEEQLEKTMSSEGQDVDMESKPEERPVWMKSKLPGVKKITNRERRRRQNETLRRLLSPKNALMVLNEMMPTDQVNNQFHVEVAQPMPGGPTYAPRAPNNFRATLTLQQTTYQGYGETKMGARNAAAEQAVRDIILTKMNKLPPEPVEGGEAEEPLPMIQLASFALHKLFAEWEGAGHRVPSLRPGPAVSESECAEEPPPKKARALPPAAADMHPGMLLTYMRPGLEYRELSVEGSRPQHMVFTVGIDVDGTTYVGQASNKKEARKAAARSACQTVFGVQFNDIARTTSAQ